LNAPVPGKWEQQRGKKKEKKEKKKEISVFWFHFLVFHGFSELAHDCSCHSKAAGCALNIEFLLQIIFPYILLGTHIMCWIASSASQLFHHRTAS
jgi:hypothetical protein